MVVAALRQQRSFRQQINLVMAWRVGYAAWLLERWCDVPYVVYVHGAEIHPARRGRVARWIMRGLLGRAALVIASSRYTADLCRQLGIDRVQVIHPGLAFREVAPEGERPPSHVLLSLGRLEERKGLDASIRAVAELAPELAALRYFIAGRGGDEARLKALAVEAGVADRVQFLGFVDEAAKQRLYRECDLLLMPSYEIPSPDRVSVEGFGIAFLEANMHGKMVVGGRSGGIADAVIDGVTGYLVDGRDPASVAAAIRRHYSRPSHARQAAACRGWARWHAWPATLRRTAAVVRRRLREVTR
jgi:phosphatidylinositol alpha-1,6-mannosyltransferase